MASLRSIKLHVPKSVRILQPGAAELYRDAINLSLREMVPQIKTIAQVETPVGATADLVKKIAISTAPNTVSIQWVAAHAAAVQFGSSAHWAPISAIRLWTQRVLGSGDPRLPYKIRASIAKKGTKPKRFLEKARSKIFQFAVPRFRERMALLARLLSGDFGP